MQTTVSWESMEIFLITAGLGTQCGGQHADSQFYFGAKVQDFHFMAFKGNVSGDERVFVHKWKDLKQRAAAGFLNFQAVL